MTTIYNFVIGSTLFTKIQRELVHYVIFDKEEPVPSLIHFISLENKEFDDKDNQYQVVDVYQLDEKRYILSLKRIKKGGLFNA